jgi:type II secretion system protein H
MRKTGRSGYTLIELLMVIAMIAIMVAVGARGARSLSSGQGPERVARTLLWEVSVARTIAIRAGDPVSLVIDRTNRRLITREPRQNATEVYRVTSFAPGSDMTVTSLATTNLTGDSLVFSARGLCTTCASVAPTSASASAISVVSQGKTYRMTINRLGRVELADQPAN